MKDLLTARWGVLLVLLLAAAPAASPAEAPQETDAATRQYATAVRLQNLESYDLAAEAWGTFLEDFKNDPRVGKATHYLGVCYFQDGKLQQALKTFEKVVRDYPRLEMLDAAELYLGVTQYSLAQAGDASMYQTAAQTFTTLVSKYPKGQFLPDALFYRGECLYMQGKKAEAVPVYSRLVHDYPDHRLAADALYALGVAQQETEQFQQAGKTYESFLAKYPKNALATEVGMRRGETFFATGDYAQAAKRFAAAAAVKGFEMADDATVRQADALAEMGQTFEAAGVYASLAQKFPRSEHLGRAMLAGGKCYYLAGSYASARKLLETLLEPPGPAAPEAAHWIAKSLLKEDAPDKALAAVEKVLPPKKNAPFAARLVMDQADALYAIPERRPESVDRYAAVAADYPKDPVAPQALYMAAFAALELNRPSVALADAETFLNAYAGHELSADVTQLAAESQLLLGKLPEAEQRYAGLLKDYPDHADAPLWHVRRALALELEKKYDRVIAALEPVLDKIHDADLQAEARYLIGSSQLELKQVKQAVTSFEASLAAQPTWRQAAETELALARAYRRLDDVDNARQTVRRLIADFPESPLLDQATYRLGEYSSLASDFDAAAAAYRELLERWPQSPLVPHALYELGSAELSRNDPAAAEKTLTRMLSEYPNHELAVEARYARALARHRLQKYAPAVEDLEAVLAADPSEADKADARYVLGLCQMGLEKYDQATETFRDLIKDDPQYPGADNARYQLAWALELAGNDAEAAGEFEKLAADFPKSERAAEAHYHVGEFAYQRKDYDKAASHYYTALETAGKSELSEKASHKLAWCYYHQEDFEKARQTFAYQQKMYPEGELVGDAAFMEAECLFEQDKFQEALDAYEKLGNLANEQFQVLALLHAGQAAGQLDQWPKSLRLLTECTEKFPQSPYLPEALYEQGWARQNMGQTDQALPLYRQVIAKTNREVAARAQFMIGEIQFQQKAHREAVKSFFKVVYGYSDPKWQAEAAYEAARCFEVLAKKTQAVKMYRELLEKFPKSDKVPLAKKRLAELEN